MTDGVLNKVKDISIGNFKDIGKGFVTFGAYPQHKKEEGVDIGGIYDEQRGYFLGSDNNLYEILNGAYYKVEPIKWKILSRCDELILASTKILDHHQFDSSENNYSKSEMKRWLNDDFYNKAFSDEQKNAIEKVCLLTRADVEKYYASNSARRKKGSDFAVNSGLYLKGDNSFALWWTSTPGSQNQVQYLSGGGEFVADNVYCSGVGVFPVLKVKL